MQEGCSETNGMRCNQMQHLLREWRLFGEHEPMQRHRRFQQRHLSHHPTVSKNGAVQPLRCTKMQRNATRIQKTVAVSLTPRLSPHLPFWLCSVESATLLQSAASGHRLGPGVFKSPGGARRGHRPQRARPLLVRGRAVALAHLPRNEQCNLQRLFVIEPGI